MVFVFSSRKQEAAAQQYPRDTYHATFVLDFQDDPTGHADDLALQQPRHLNAFLPVLQHVPCLSRLCSKHKEIFQNKFSIPKIENIDFKDLFIFIIY